MSKKKIHELAKEIDIKSKDIVSFLKDKGLEKTHMSSIDESEVSLIKTHFKRNTALFVSTDKTESSTIIKKAPAVWDNKMAEDDKNKAVEAKSIKFEEQKKQVKSNQGEHNLQEQLDNTDRRPNSQNQGDKDRRIENQNRGDRDRRIDGQNQGDRDRRPVNQGQGDRDRRPGNQGQGDRDRRSDNQGDRNRHFGGQSQGDREHRPVNQGQGDRDRRSDNQYRGDRDRRPINQDRDRRPEGQNQGERRPEGQNQGERRPEGQNQGERRPEGQNQGERRPGSQYQGDRDRRPGYQGDRDRRPGYQGDRERRPAGQYQGDRDRRPEGQNQGDRERRYDSSNQGDKERRFGNQNQGDRERRPDGQHQDRRPVNQGDREYRTDGQYQDRRQSSQGPGGQYQDRRPGGQNQGGQYQDRRPGGQSQGGQYQDRRPGGQSQGGQYQDRRPGGQSQGGQYQDRRPGGQSQGGQYQDRRPGGQSQGGQYQDRRPGGQSQGGQYQDRRPGGQSQGGQYHDRRPGGQSQGGQGQGGQYQGNRNNFGTSFDKDKDKDSSYNNRGYDKRRQDTRGTDKSTIKTDLVNELTKEQRAAAFKEKDRDKNKSKKRDDTDTVKSRSGKSKKDPNRKGAFIMPKPLQVVKEPEDEIKSIMIPEFITIKELAEKMKKPASTVVKKLFLEGKMVSINQEISFEEAEEIAIGYDIIAEKEIPVDIVAEVLKEEDEDSSLMEKRPPVVCVMGHVDHGKTSLLDAIRETNVTSREAGGITQHIGAYVVEINGETITFLDTPGHEAFTSMRMRGAKSTDIAILVIAADDGVMPQTIEAISHAKAAGVQIIVAVNKIDKPSANIERVKQELTEYNLVAEDWGGDTVFVPVSAHTKEGIDTLLEMILLTADILELRANRNRKARGIVIEAELDKGKGTVATILVQKGTLHIGDSVAIGASFGKVRAMMDDKGRRVKEATVSTPVEILGLNEVPNAGEIFIATDTEKEARNIAETFIKQGRERLLADTKAKLSLDGLFTQIKAGNIKELNLIIKADVQGSVEAVKQSMLKLSNDEVAVRIVHGGVGTVNESDVTLAATSNAIIIGFNVRTDNTAREIAEREKVDLRLYKVIYNAIEDVESAMKGLLDPIYEEKVIAHAEVRQIFKASGLGVIAGSYVLDGKITRGCLTRITREGKKIYEGSLASLKRFKDDVKEVATGYECGLVFEKFNDLQEFDQVEFYIMKEVPR